VTGGASGIGRACALAFARNGADVAIADADPAMGEETIGLLEEAGVHAFFTQVDVASTDAMQSFFGEVEKRFGRLDHAVNAAGIQGPIAETAEYSVEEWRRTIDVNLTGVFLAVKHEVGLMLKGEGGSIVNIASNFGLVGARAIPAYAASKHGVVGLGKVAGLDYATRGVRVNTLCPGGTDTPMVQRNIDADPVAGKEMVEAALALHPMGRLATPEEIAAAALWLCSEQASYVTGAVIPVDGGFVAQ
jgi:NAD(P)-dependent dehydrogenase (short-subunit alcohol dehydrogenase family)